VITALLAERPLGSTSQLVEEMQSVLQGKPSELMQTALWNGGFYLWWHFPRYPLRYSPGGSLINWRSGRSKNSGISQGSILSLTPEEDAASLSSDSD